LEGEGKEARIVIEDAIARAGKNPKELATDGLGSYSAALEQSGSEIDHVRNVGISHRGNNSRIEAFHGMVRGGTKSRRGMKGRWKQDLEGFSSYYNFVRPHQGRANKPPNQTSKNRWLSVIRNAPP
jgi:transposase-like protein